ncbi:MAG: hypothetical protein V1801_01900 [Candidatus Falkowbacteria bacterium]
MKNIIKISIILILLINIFAIGVLTVSAAETTIIGKADCSNYKCSAGDTSEQSKICCGNYSLNDMVSVVTKIAAIILSIVGSLSLLAFVAGGLMMMLSAGNPEWVTRGKQTIIGAVIGLVIVFTSYTIIFFVFKSLGITEPVKGWFTSGWF